MCVYIYILYIIYYIGKGTFCVCLFTFFLFFAIINFIGIESETSLLASYFVLVNIITRQMSQAKSGHIATFAHLNLTTKIKI